MNVTWFIVVVAILAVLQMQYYSRRGLAGVTYERFFDRETVFEGETVELVELLENRKWTPLPWLRVESRISPFLRFRGSDDVDIRHDQFHRSVFFLRPFRRVRRRHSVRCLKRGYYDLRSAGMTTGDLFGVVSRSRDIASRAELYVYPRIPAEGELVREAVRFQGDVSARRFILPDPILVTGIRDYRPGDMQRDVHWGATARTGRLQVKVRDHTNAPRALLVFNTQISERNWRGLSDEEEALLEGGLRAAAYIAHALVRQGSEVGFFSNGALADMKGRVAVEPGASFAQLHLLLRTMARLRFVIDRSFHQLLDDLVSERRAGADIAILSVYWSPALETRAQALRRLGNTVTHIPVSVPWSEEADDGA